MNKAQMRGRDGVITESFLSEAASIGHKISTSLSEELTKGRSEMSSLMTEDKSYNDDFISDASVPISDNIKIYLKEIWKSSFAETIRRIRIS